MAGILGDIESDDWPGGLIPVPPSGRNDTGGGFGKGLMAPFSASPVWPQASYRPSLTDVDLTPASAPLQARIGARVTRALSPSVSADQLRRIMPQAREDDIQRYLPGINAAVESRGMNRYQQAAFLAQASVESGQLRQLTEEPYFRTAERAQKVYGKDLFPDAESAVPYLKNSEKMANYAYAGKNGNRAGTDDGYKYRGRGLIHLTGRANYAETGHEDNPAALDDPVTAAEASARWWTNRRLNDKTASPLDRAEFDKVTRTVNGKGLEPQRRWEAYQRALDALDR